MASRLHFATRYQVKYSEDSFFGRGQVDFYYLLKSLGINMSGISAYDSDFDIPKEDWKNAIENLKKNEENQELEEALKDLQYSKEVVLEIFKKILKECESNCDYIHISWY